MEDKKSLAEYGLTSTTARAQTPASIGLATRNAGELLDFAVLFKKRMLKEDEWLACYCFLPIKANLDAFTPSSW